LAENAQTRAPFPRHAFHFGKIIVSFFPESERKRKEIRNRIHHKTFFLFFLLLSIASRTIRDLLPKLLKETSRAAVTHGHSKTKNGNMGEEQKTAPATKK
jgi:hypothetical protein